MTRGRSPRTSSVCQRTVISSARRVVDRVALAGGHHRVVERGQHPGDPDVRLQQGAPRRLGRVRGEHELERDVGETLVKLVLGHVGEQLERLFERLAHDEARVLVLAAAADAVVLLGRVRELEVQREGAEHLRLVVGLERADGLAHDRRVADLARLPRGGADALLGREELLALLLDEHLPEQRAEQADVAPQRAVRLLVARLARSGSPVGSVTATDPYFAARLGAGRCRGAAAHAIERTSSTAHAPSVSSCSAIITRPASCWSFSAAGPSA